MRLTLYQRDDCHLCDLALEELAGIRAPEFDSVFIDDDPVLEERYGLRVPVLRDEDRGVELDWPFDGAGLRKFLSPPPSNLEGGGWEGVAYESISTPPQPSPSGKGRE